MYEIYQLPSDAVGGNLDARDASNDCKRGTGNSAVFVARNRYAVLNKATQVFNIVYMDFIDLANNFKKSQ